MAIVLDVVSRVLSDSKNISPYRMKPLFTWKKYYFQKYLLALKEDFENLGEMKTSVRRSQYTMLFVQYSTACIKQKIFRKGHDKKGPHGV